MLEVAERHVACNSVPPLTTQPIEAVAMASPTIPIRVPSSTLDLAWAAGFLEGEGSFGHYGGPRVSAAQVQKEPIDRLVRIFGGKMWQRTTKGFGAKPIWVWQPPARRGVEIMMTLYVMMSPKRKREIEWTLKVWARGRLLKSHASNTCGRGHELTAANSFLVGRYRKCRECRNAAKRARRARLRSAIASIDESVSGQ